MKRRGSAAQSGTEFADRGPPLFAGTAEPPPADFASLHPGYALIEPLARPRGPWSTRSS